MQKVSQKRNLSVDDVEHALVGGPVVAELTADALCSLGPRELPAFVDDRQRAPSQAQQLHAPDLAVPRRHMHRRVATCEKKRDKKGENGRRCERSASEYERNEWGKLRTVVDDVRARAGLKQRVDGVGLAVERGDVEGRPAEHRVDVVHLGPCCAQIVYTGTT